MTKRFSIAISNLKTCSWPNAVSLSSVISVSLAFFRKRPRKPRLSSELLTICHLRLSSLNPTISRVTFGPLACFCTRCAHFNRLSMLLLSISWLRELFLENFSQFQTTFRLKLANLCKACCKLTLLKGLQFIKSSKFQLSKEESSNFCLTIISKTNSHIPFCTIRTFSLNSNVLKTTWSRLKQRKHRKKRKKPKGKRKWKRCRNRCSKCKLINLRVTSLRRHSLIRLKTRKSLIINTKNTLSNSLQFMEETISTPIVRLMLWRRCLIWMLMKKITTMNLIRLRQNPEWTSNTHRIATALVFLLVSHRCPSKTWSTFHLATSLTSKNTWVRSSVLPNSSRDSKQFKASVNSFTRTMGRRQCSNWLEVSSRIAKLLYLSLTSAPPISLFRICSLEIEHSTFNTSLSLTLRKYLFIQVFILKPALNEIHKNIFHK